MPLLKRSSDTALEEETPVDENVDIGEVVDDFLRDEDSDDREQTSPRLRRLSAYFANQLRLIEDSGAQVEQEVDPWRQLLGRQAATIARIMANLDVRLGPIREYAENEEASLRALQEKIGREGMDFVAHSFSDLVSAQSERVEETRALIDRQQEPFERFHEDERRTVEVVLERFDEDIAALEQSLADQVAVLERLLDSMRSEEFRQVSDYLGARQGVLERVAEGEITDPSAIAAQLARVVDGFQFSRADEWFGSIWEATAASDDALMMSGTQPEPMTRGLDGEPTSQLEGAPDGGADAVDPELGSVGAGIATDAEQTLAEADRTD